MLCWQRANWLKPVQTRFWPVVGSWKGSRPVLSVCLSQRDRFCSLLCPRGSVSVICSPKGLLGPSASGELALRTLIQPFVTCEFGCLCLVFCLGNIKRGKKRVQSCHLLVHLFFFFKKIVLFFLFLPPLHLECKFRVVTWICSTADSLGHEFLRGLLLPRVLRHQLGSTRCPGCFLDLIPPRSLYIEGPHIWKVPSPVAQSCLNHSTLKKCQ